MKKVVLAVMAALMMTSAANAATITIKNHTQVWVYGTVERHDSFYTGRHESLDIAPGQAQTITNVYKLSSKLGWINAPGYSFEDGIRTDRHFQVDYWQLSPGVYAEPQVRQVN